MTLYDSALYCKEVQEIADLPIEWRKLQNKTVLISGATGMIGSFLTDVLLHKWEVLHCRVIALGRDLKKAQDRFGAWLDGDRLQFYPCDVCQGVSISEEADFVLHLASNTHPLAYAKAPVETILTNITGTKNLLDYARVGHITRFIFASTVEIYGENRGDVEQFDEQYCGYIDCNTMRAGYPESKRAGEALCQAYIHQYGLDVVIPRFPRLYGPTMQSEDSKASSQFIKKAVAGEDIILKSKGDQYFTYCHVADAVSGLLYCLLQGACGEAYNIASGQSDIHLCDLAKIAADCAGTKVKFELPDAVEKSGYSKAMTSRLDGTKLMSLGWREKFSLPMGLKETIRILRETK